MARRIHRLADRLPAQEGRALAEIETGLGEVRRFGPGDILFADDTTGRGHISRDVAGPRQNLFLPLPDDLDISAWRVRP